jgi:hypothetical protein
MFVDTVLGVLLRDVVTLEFVAADDGAEWLVDVVGRVARVAAWGGIRAGGQLVCIFGSVRCERFEMQAQSTASPTHTHVINQTSKSTSTVHGNPKNTDRQNERTDLNEYWTSDKHEFMAPSRLLSNQLVSSYLIENSKGR